MPEPTIAVIIPTYNRSGYLRQALESVMGQTRPPDEVIVIDDGSTDDTAKVCSEYPRACYHYQNNQGLGSARNAGIQAALTSFVSFLDDDDLLVENAIEQQLAAFAANPSVSLVYGRTMRIDADGNTIDEDLVGHRMPTDIRIALFRENFVRIQTVMVRRDDLLAVGCFETSIWCEDYDLWLRLALAGKEFHYIPAILAHYRVHQGSMSVQIERAARAGVTVVEKRGAGLPGYFTANAHYRLGRTLLENGNKAEALHELRIAVRHRPTSLRYRFYATLAAHPMLMGSGFRMIQRAKRSCLQGLVRAGLTEKRWGG